MKVSISLCCGQVEVCMRISVCVGDYATSPYRIPGLELAVYSMEELCYCLKENAFLLDTSIMNDSLLEWIANGCGVGELARELHPMVHKQGSLSGFVCMIMDYVGMYPEAEVQKVEQILKQGAGLSQIEKRKSQLDFLVQKKKYAAALRGYAALLERWQELEAEGRELPAGQVRASIFYNMGVTSTRLMLYGQAAEAFWQAYELTDNPVYLEAYLAAKRMELAEGDYIAHAAKIPNSYEISLDLEKKLEVLQESWKEQADYQRLQVRKECRNGSDKQKYYDENDRLMEALKNSYRSSVME